MNGDGTPVKTPSGSRRRIAPPKPQESPRTLLKDTPRQMEVEDQEFGVCEKEHEAGHR